MKLKALDFLSITGILSVALDMPITSSATATAESAADASTLNGKVMAGYQAWFRCPGDAADVGWRHWCEKNRFEPATVHTDFWPDMSAYGSIRKYPAPGFTDAKGNQSYVYSACDPAPLSAAPANRPITCWTSASASSSPPNVAIRWTCQAASPSLRRCRGRYNSLFLGNWDVWVMVIFLSSPGKCGTSLG